MMDHNINGQITSYAGIAEYSFGTGLHFAPRNWTHRAKTKRPLTRSALNVRTLAKVRRKRHVFSALRAEIVIAFCGE